MEVVKRNGNFVKFDKNKIINAINKAFLEVDNKENEIAIKIAEAIEKEPTNVITVEQIQDLVESYLMDSDRHDVARAYVRYRYKKEVAREIKSDFFDAIGEKLQARNVQNANANLDEHSFGGRIGEASSYMTRQYALDYLVSPMSKENHEQNMIYIHDLDHYCVGDHNCLTIPFDELLAKGFNTRQVDIRPANSLSTAMQLIAVIFQLQSLQQFGGVSAGHLDWTMVPYVRKSFHKHFRDGIFYIEQKIYDCSPPEGLEITDLAIDGEFYTSLNYSNAYDYAMDMTTREIYQSVEAMYHNLNSLQSRSGNQLPFTSINYGTCTLAEGRMITKAILDVSIEGLGKFYKTSIFPCGIFQMMKGVNRFPGEPNYDLYQLALQSTAKRLYPNYANCDWSGNAGYDPNDPRTIFSTMGCRTANGADINAEPGVNPQTKDGRGNICPVTIIMPELAMQAKESFMNEYDDNIINVFMSLLDKKIHEAKDMLIERYKWICSQSPDSAKFMYENHVILGYKPEEGIESALKHGTLSLGQIGLAETLQILIGKDHTTEEGMKLAKHIEQLFKDRCAQFKQEYKLNFGVYYTPAEGLCFTSLKKFREKWGIIPNVSDKDFFTNSIHVPVWTKVSPFEKIDIESQLTGYSSAGCITYVELDASAIHNIKALEQIVNYAMDKDIPYFAINVPSDTCLNCGFQGEMNDSCPVCGSTNIEQLRRVTGYLTGNYKTAFNLGKQDEVHHRTRHVGVIE